MRTLLFLPALALVIVGLPAQQAVLPVGLASVEGNSATTYPWSRIVNSTRVQYVYDPANFTMQSLGSVVITRVKWREDGNVNSQGSVYTNVAIDMSSSARAHTALSTTFADNHGPDQTRVYTGTVTTAPGSSAPGPWYVDIPLQTPFFCLSSSRCRWVNRESRLPAGSPRRT